MRSNASGLPLIGSSCVAQFSACKCELMQRCSEACNSCNV